MKSIYDQIWEATLHLIQFRMTSRHELQKKLLAKFPQEEGEIIKVLDEMVRVLLLDDKRYTEQLVHHLIQKPIGRIKLKIEARKRGVNEDLFQSLLLDAGFDEAVACQRALEEKEGQVRETDPRKRKFKLMNFLRNRGFTDNTIYQVLRTQD